MNLSLKELSELEQREARALAQIESDWAEASKQYQAIQQCHRNEKRLWIVAALALGAVLMLVGWFVAKAL